MNLYFRSLLAIAACDGMHNRLCNLVLGCSYNMPHGCFVDINFPLSSFFVSISLLNILHCY